MNQIRKSIFLGLIVLFLSGAFSIVVGATTPGLSNSGGGT